MALGLDQLLAHVVERKGYHVQGADKEALFAKKGEETLLAAWKTDAPLTAEDARIFLTAFAQVGATNGILVAPKGADQAAKDAFAASKVEVWAESRLVVEVGECLVREALETTAPSAPSHFPSNAPSQAAIPSAPVAKGPTKFPSLVAQAAGAASGSGNGIAYYMPNKKKEAPADMRATIPQGRGGSLGYAWGGAPGTVARGADSAGIAQVMPSKPRIKTDQWGNVVPNGAAGAAAAPVAMEHADAEVTGAPRRGRVANPAATGAAPPVVIDSDAEAYEIIDTKKQKKQAAAATAGAVVRDAAPPACSALKLTVTKEEAVAKTGKAGTAKLALVPHVAFEFDLEMNRPGMPAPVTAKGAILINSISGDLRSVDALEFAASEPTDARKDAEKLTAVDVYDKVKAHMTKTFSKTLSVEREVAGNTVMENMKLAPEPDEMNLQHRGIVWCPVWEVTGSTGVTKVDAFTGAVL